MDDVIAGNSFTLYQCSPLHNFLSKKRTLRYFKTRLAQRLLEEFNWIVESQANPNGPQPSGQITVLRFEHFDLKGNDADQADKESSPLQLILECNVKGKNSSQSLVLFPARRTLKEGQHKDYLWYYPLILSKVTKGVFRAICSVFEEEYNARMNPLTIPAKFMEQIIYINAESLCSVDLEDYENSKAQGISPLRLEYATQLSDVETLQFDIEAEEVFKVCKLAGGSKKFYKAFCRHILNSTKINLPSTQIISLSCHIVSLTLSGRLKIHKSGPSHYAYEVLEQLVVLACVEVDDLSWV